MSEPTELDVLRREVQSQDEAIRHLKDCVRAALEQTAQRDGSPVRPEDVLDEDWSS